MSSEVAAKLEHPWVSGHQVFPEAYEPSSIMDDGWARCLEPTSRVGVTYMDPPYEVAAPPEGTVFHGIGCDWKETGIAAPRVSVLWGGYHTAPHLEIAPLVHVVPGTARHAMGAWTSKLFGAQVVYAGTIGNPPELFAEQLLDFGSFSTVNGTPTRVEVRSTGTLMTVWVNGSQVSMASTGLAGVPVPEELQGSTLHGVAFDTHLVDPEDIPDYDLWRSWRCVANT